MRWKFAHRMATRFVAGDFLEDAVEAIKSLNKNGIYATLDHLGENTTNEKEAEQATLAIIEMIDAIYCNKIQSNVSIKLSQIGFNLGDDICLTHLRKIVTEAKSKDIFVRIDMEDSSTVDKTISFYKTLRNEGYTNVGLVIQAYLYRSEKDIQSLMELFTPIRLCKGAYNEPSTIAFPRKVDVDKNYDKLAEILLETSSNDKNLNRNERDGVNPPLAALATHDEKRIHHIKEYAKKRQIGKNYYEFQMLYGIRRDLQENLVKEGYAVRVYVPFGSQWYPYFMRRLAERPANLWFMLTNLLR